MSLSTLVDVPLLSLSYPNISVACACVAQEAITVYCLVARPRHRPQSPDRGSVVPGPVPGQHPAGVRGPAHQGHQDDAGRGGGLQDKGGRKQISLLTLGI